MKISFIVPTWHYLNDPFKLQPYWELYYSTIIKKNMNTPHIKIYDLRGKSRGNNFENVLSEINEEDFYLYWIMKSGDAMEIYSIVDYLKKKYPNSKHIAGGTHVDMLPDETSKIFDSIVVGPGEESFINAINDNCKITRYTQDYKKYPFFETPYPDRSLLPKDNLINKNMFKQYGDYNATMVYFSRGCFYSCSYCVYNVPNQLQSKSSGLITQEINDLKENYNVEAILLKDEIALNPNKKIFYSQMEAIGNENVKWRGQTTSVGTEEHLKIASETGCLELSVGVETVDNNVMKIINKKWQNDKIIKTFIENAKKYGIKIKMCLIFGLPGEPRNIVEKTIKFIDDHKPDYVSLSGFCPFPGSPIYKSPEKYGIKKIDKNWDNHAHLLYRFSNEEVVGIPFEYEENAEWGKTFTKNEIVQNIVDVQRWLQQNQMTY